MTLKKKKLKILFFVFLSLVFSSVIIFLFLWTRSVEKQKKQEDLKETIKLIVESYGEQGLLSLAGISVNDIYYGDEGITFFSSSNKEWTYSAQEMENISVFQKCNTAVVHIRALTNISYTTDLSETESFIVDVNSLDYISTKNNTGSGFFVSSDGYICTNYHVVSGANSIIVTTWNNIEYNAKLVGYDSENDIAVLKISPNDSNGFSYLDFASSDELLVGQRVFAIGNPFGYSRSMSLGIVSGLSRNVRNSNGSIMLGMIQTDVQINPGNSGGPLLNSKGKVVGVCASIYTSTGQNQGMNFAISSNTAQGCVQEIIKTGKVEKTWLDIVPVQLSKQIIDYASLKVSKGILVSQVVPNGKAMNAGLHGGTRQVKYGNSLIYLGGDIITNVNGFDVATYSDLFNALAGTKPGDKVNVKVNRNGNSIVLRVELVERTSELLSWINR